MTIQEILDRDERRRVDGWSEYIRFAHLRGDLLAECAPAAPPQEKDHGAELIGQVATDMAGTEPRPNNAPIDDGCTTEPDGVHVYQNNEVHTGCTVVIALCACGKRSFGWHHGPPNRFERDMVQLCDHCMSHMVPS
ncbi:hypothetical protein UFOVP1601_12 [uncultured Caudovirales phage]|uniref:Uncharacterized protein n=1 Tax=uncultured Caudovirales phage TaxID=2100421 RepID=A0A6J5QXU3_9CAUD|nr:hypothetical protein UFOVP1154_22 [uncultured Caudovirales phage]CAB4199976.1 hypothetical protein UFOVP1341_15 [uncultured Caudovirales phage]CAB4218330.1 hypothetical protein UFOVP1601_12 [uncultured Caudovirales phage]